MTIRATGLSVDLGRRRVVDTADFAADGGGLIGVIGPNGAGKSSFVRALLGLLPAAGGDVAIDGEPLGGLSRRHVARRIAYLPQGQAVHWPLAVERIVALGRLPHLAPLSRLSTIDAAAVEQAMATADVLHLRGRAATALSGGERARVLLARALAVEAPALIADEPLAALDPGHQIEVMGVLRRLSGAGVLVIAVLHDLGLAARHCDRLVLLDRGRIAGDGPPDEVLTPAALATVFGIRAWRGTVEGGPLLVPIDRAT